jgi:acetyl-CoA acetyltransferase
MTSKVADVFIYDAVRTPTGAYGGGLAEIRPDDLAAGVIKSLLLRNQKFRLILQP